MSRGVWQVLIVCFSVVLLLLYPTLNRSTTSMNKCDVYNFGDGTGELHLLREDYGIDCVRDHGNMRTISLIFLGVYGVGIPIAFPLLGMLFYWRLGEPVEVDCFAFLFVGFKKKYRYWESVNLVRKLLMVAIMTFIPDMRLRVRAHAPAVPHECRDTGRCGGRNALTRRSMRREEWVTVQGPMQKPQPDGMSHGGGGGGAVLVSNGFLGEGGLGGFRKEPPGQI